MSEPRLTCDEVAALTGGYALDALSPAERAAVVSHLDECELHAELRELRLAAAAVGLAVKEVTPPPSLRARVLEFADSDPTAERSSESDRVGGWSSFLARPQIAYAIAASLAVVALLVGVAIGDSSGGGDTRFVSVIDASGAGEHRLSYVADSDLAVLSVRGLSDLDATHVYQVWLIRGDDAARSIGLFATHNGEADVALSLNLEDGDVIAVTVEPAGGSLQPTTDILISGSV